MTSDSPPSPVPAPEPSGAAGADRGPDDRMAAGQWVRLGLVLGLLVLLTAFTGVWGLVMVLGLMVMIFLHELGHFVMAKRAGMKVTEFFLGFGPRVWSFRRGETEYGLKVIPAGAYVKVVGMHNLEEVDPADEARAYRQKSFGARMGVAVAGSAMHFLLALVLLYALLVGFGFSGGALEPDSARWEVATVSADSAAEAAGLRVGDRIVAIDGRPVTSFAQVRDAVVSRPGRDVALVVARGDAEVATRATLGRRVVDGETAGFLGVAPRAPIERFGPVEAVPRTLREFGVVSVETVKAMGRFFTPSGVAGLGRQVVDARSDAAARRPEPPTVAPGATPAPVEEAAPEERVMSILGIFRVGVDVGDAGGVSSLLVLFVFINVFIGIFNLTPMLPFDGGHVVIAVYEKVQEKRRRLAGRYFADVGRLLPATYAVILALALLFVSTLYLDIANPLTLN